MGIRLIQKNQAPVTSYDDAVMHAMMLGKDAFAFEGIGDCFESAEKTATTITIDGGIGMVGGREFSFSSAEIDVTNEGENLYWTVYARVSTQYVLANAAEVGAKGDGTVYPSMTDYQSYETEKAVSTCELIRLRKPIYGSLNVKRAIKVKKPGVADKALCMTDSGYINGVQITDLVRDTGVSYFLNARNADEASMTTKVNGSIASEAVFAGETIVISRPLTEDISLDDSGGAGGFRPGAASNMYCWFENSILPQQARELVGWIIEFNFDHTSEWDRGVFGLWSKWEEAGERRLTGIVLPNHSVYFKLFDRYACIYGGWEPVLSVVSGSDEDLSAAPSTDGWGRNWIKVIASDLSSDKTASISVEVSPYGWDEGNNVTSKENTLRFYGEIRATPLYKAIAQ